MIYRLNQFIQRSFKGIFLSILILLNTGSFFLASVAASPDFEGKLSDQPITIDSDRLESDRNNRLITFKGNVTARQGEMIIHSDVLLLSYLAKEGEIEKVVAQGNVKIIQKNENRIATSGEAVYYNLERKVVLTKKPKIRQGKDVVSGETITLFIDENRSIVEGGKGKRVNAIIYPKEN